MANPAVRQALRRAHAREMATLHSTDITKWANARSPLLPNPIPAQLAPPIHAPPSPPPPPVRPEFWKVVVGGNVFDLPTQPRRMTPSQSNVAAWTLPEIKSATVRTYDKDVNVFFDASCMYIDRSPSDRMRSLATKTTVLYRENIILAIGWLDDAEIEQEWTLFAVKDLDVPPGVHQRMDRLEYIPLWDMSITLSWSRIPLLTRIYHGYLRAWLPPSIQARIDVKQERKDVALVLDTMLCGAPADKRLRAIAELAVKLCSFEMSTDEFLDPCPITYKYYPYRSYKGCAHTGGVVNGRTTTL